MTTEEFIARAKQVHGDKYDYSLVEYVNAHTKIKIICPVHGVFEQTPDGHLKHGCSKCSGNAKMNTVLFIEKAKQVHGNKYDYSKVVYKNTSTKVCIICPEHGEFWQTPNSHLNGAGCNQCCKNAKVTYDEFITKAKEVHGDKYDYSKVKYVNVSTKVCIICPEHGEFWQTPSQHLSGRGCQKCGYNQVWEKRGRTTTEDFIKRAREVHGNKFDYSKTVYKDTKTEVCIICPEHGEFWQKPEVHLTSKNGCPKCYGKNKTTEDFIKEAKKVHGDKYDYSKTIYKGALEKVCIKDKTTNIEFWQLPNNHLKCDGSKFMTTESFILKAREVHGDKYDYSKVNYTKSGEKVCIICPIHGEFWQTPKNHLGGNGCPKCSHPNVKKTTEDFIKEARKVHGDKYNYSKTVYKNAKTKVCIICPEHGEFWQEPYLHLKGSGCKKCIMPNANMTTEEFVEKANKVHNGIYNYSKVKYINATTKICIICPKHGEFWQRANEHLLGKGCPLCNHGLTKQYKFNLLEEFENEYAFRAFLENNDINILLSILINIEPKYEPIKKDIERALAHASETNPIQSLREKYSSDAEESDDDDYLDDTNTTDTDDFDWDNDDEVNDMISQESEAETDTDTDNELSIDDIIRNDEEEIRVINRLDSEHLITPEVREYIKAKYKNDMRRAWMAKRDNK